MLTHPVPWQAMVAYRLEREILFGGLVVLSVLSGYWNWWIGCTALFLIAGFFIILSLIPILLNFSRAFFFHSVIHFLIHVTGTIISFALHHHAAGLVDGRSGHPFAPTFIDALYFSVTTFTTLGYGDLQPIPTMRVATSIEALIGMLSIALTASMVWLWCQENIVDKELAFFDANRRHKKDMAISRIRIRTITGKERRLPDWKLPPRPGESYYHDRERGEWLPVTPETELPENAFVVGLSEDTDEGDPVA